MEKQTHEGEERRMRTLIVGADSLLGRYMFDFLSGKEAGTVFPVASSDKHVDALESVMVEDEDAVRSLIERTSPDRIFYFTDQESISYAWEYPDKVVDAQIKGSLNLLEAVRKERLQSRLVLVGSGDEYGRIGFDEVPVKETHPLLPTSVYSVAKIGQEMMTQLYHKTYGLDVVIARSFNEIAPGQADRYAVSGFCRQVAELERDRSKNKLFVGNLNVRRAFIDARDVVRALYLLAENGIAGDLYNVGRSNSISVREVLELILSMTDIRPEIVSAKDKVRQIDIPILEADCSKLKSLVDWEPQYDLKTTIYEMLEYWRDNV